METEKNRAVLILIITHHFPLGKFKMIKKNQEIAPVHITATNLNNKIFN